MKLVHLACMRYSVPFRDPFYTAHGALSYRSGALVSIHTDTGVVGYGEIAPLPEHHGHTLDTSLNALSRVARELSRRELLDSLRFLETQSADDQLPAPLICGLETALLDAYGKAHNRRVADVLLDIYPAAQANSTAMPRTLIPVNAVISGATVDAVVASARRAMAEGFTCLKLKLTDASPRTLTRVEAVRAAIGPTPRLRLDANESWSADEAGSLLAHCAAFDIEYVEQPLPARDLAGMATLRRSSPIPLAADEALTGLESARRIIQAKAADVLILKPQLAGGPRVCRRIIQEASAQGISCVITSTLETGIGVMAALHLAAASPEVIHPCGLATLNLLTTDLLQSSPPLHQGLLELPAGPGLGVDPDISMLKLDDNNHHSLS